jgi:hypothetical protein
LKRGAGCLRLTGCAGQRGPFLALTRDVDMLLHLIHTVAIAVLAAALFVLPLSA